MIKKLETQDVFLSIENGILICSYKPHLEIDLVTAKRIIKDREDFTAGVSYPILVDFTNMKLVTKEARDYMNSPGGGLKGLLGGAFLSKSAVATLFINLYLKVSTPLIPAKFFTDKKAAIDWLMEIKSKNR